jgi:hypothetical protein
MGRPWRPGDFILPLGCDHPAQRRTDGGVTRQGPLFARALNNTRRTTRVARRPIGVMDPYHPVVRCHIYATAVGVRRYRYSR